jgi:hypothetical protein
MSDRLRSLFSLFIVIAGAAAIAFYAPVEWDWKFIIFVAFIVIIQWAVRFMSHRL